MQHNGNKSSKLKSIAISKVAQCNFSCKYEFPVIEQFQKYIRRNQENIREAFIMSDLLTSYSVNHRDIFAVFRLDE